MKVIVTGTGGQLGFECMKELNRRGIDCLGADIQEFDITDFTATHKFITDYGPDAVIHCSAYTSVDKAEDNQEVCRKVNALGPENIAKVCKEIGAKMVFISTDYVFDGQGTQFWQPDDAADPLNFYGQTKWEGEQAVRKYLDKHFIVRISWAFGKNGSNFIKTMLKLSQTHDEVRVVDDQVGSPTYMLDLAPLLCDMIMTDKYGTYHATNEGICSFAEFAEEIFRQAGVDCKVNHIPSSEYPTPAKRPFNSRMSKEKLTANGFKKLPTWQDAVRRFLLEVGE